MFKSFKAKSESQASAIKRRLENPDKATSEHQKVKWNVNDTWLSDQLGQFV